MKKYFIDNRYQSLKYQQGLSLIESLVTLIILSIGLLGVASLQANSLRVNHGSLIRTQAIILTEDIIDRMRANRAGAIKGNYNFSTTISPNKAISIIDKELSQWKEHIETKLTQGNGAIDCIQKNHICTIKIQWQESKNKIQTYLLSTKI